MKSAQKLIYASVIVAVIGIVSKVWLFGALVRLGIRDQTSLRKRNEIRDIYLRIPFPLNFKIYFFNVTNPVEIQKGAKPIVKEVGPYWFDEFKEKVDVVDNETEDSLTYSPYDVYKFNQNKSGALKADDYVTIINPIMVGMVNLVLKQSPVFLSIVNKSLPAIFNDPQTIFITTKVKDLLFDGIELNCTSKEFSVSAICSQMKSKMPALKFREDNENVFLFSIFGSKNATLTNRIKILRGIHHNRDLGKLIEVDGKKKINLWGSEKCNRFEGTDGWIFPPMMDADEGLKAFSPDLCRNIKMNYVEDTVYKNVHVRIYAADLGDQTNDEDEKCYCSTENTCLKKGVFELTKCMGVPIFVTLPHFFRTDEMYLGQVDGMQPDMDKHGLVVYFESMTGVPLLAAKRLQLNLDLEPTNKIALFSKLPRALFPIFWLEESIDLDGDLLKKIQGIFMMLQVADILIYCLIVLGFVSLGVALYFHFKNRKEVTITPVSRFENNNSNDYDTSDMQYLNRKPIINEKMGVINHAMSGHEFDRY